jgi:hypothetical protein
MRRYLVVAAAVFTALALAGTAVAADVGPRAQGYQGPGESVQGQLGNQGVAGEEAGFGALPFSGQDLTLLAIGGAVLILVGSGFHRLSRRRQ